MLMLCGMINICFLLIVYIQKKKMFDQRKEEREDGSEGRSPKSVFTTLRTELCKAMPLEKLYRRLEQLETAEANEIAEIRRKYQAEADRIRQTL